jgi:long-subunit fatty acid transport protein
MRSITPLIPAALLAVLLTPTAHAGGFEIPGAGAVDLGRGGAWYAKADTSMALRYNPAALARMPSRSNIDVNVGLLFYDACFDRGGTYDTNSDGSFVGGNPAGGGAYDTIFPATSGGTFNPYSDTGVANPRVCNQTGPGPVPQIGYAFRLPKLDKLAFGVGIFAPHARGAQRYGDSTGTVATGDPDFPLGPTPTRYVLAESSNVQVFPTLGVAYAVHPRFNVGFAFGWGITQVDFVTFTQPFPTSENPNDDVRSKLSARDGFVPRINFSVDAMPVDGLHLMAGFQWTQSIDTHGNLELTSHHFMSEADRALNGGETILLDRTRLRAGQSSVLSAGVNYGLARKGAVAGEIPDGLGTQVFDVELSFNYDFHGRMDEYEVNPAASGPTPDITVYNFATAPPSELTIQKRWKNQYVFRFGGDVNIVPGVFALRAGAWYESSGITPGYAGLDFYIPRRVGTTVGATVRIKRTDLSLAYAHVFYDDTDYRESGGAVQGNTPLGPGTLVNNGLIQAKMNILTAGLRYHFR